MVQDLLEAKFNLSFLLEHLCSLAHALFQRQGSKGIDAEIAAAEETLARAHKTLQDLKIKRQKLLHAQSTSAKWSLQFPLYSCFTFLRIFSITLLVASA